MVLCQLAKVSNFFVFNWSQDAFIARVTKSVETSSKKSKKKQRKWMTKEEMKIKNGWSAQSASNYSNCSICYDQSGDSNNFSKIQTLLSIRAYIKDVAAFCDKDKKLWRWLAPIHFKCDNAHQCFVL